MPGAESRGAISAPALQGRRLVMRDNVHLFDPGAEHHEVLATEGTGATSAGKPFAPPYASPCVQTLLADTEDCRLNASQLDHVSALQETDVISTAYASAWPLACVGQDTSS